MAGSLHLFKLRGIAVKMHLTFPFILIWSAFQFGVLNDLGWRGAVFGVVVTLLLFIIVILHELGHSLAALHYDVPVHQIILLPLGGVAQLARMPEKPIQEFVIAIAGPMVNLLLVLALSVLGFMAGLQIPWGFTEGFLTLLPISAQSVFGYIFASNLFLGFFNIFPAFPMDGGRVLRALLASRMKYSRATVIAVSIGQGLAILLGLWGLLGGGFILVLIAIFIFFGAGQEGHVAQLRSVLEDVIVDQAYSRHVYILHAEDRLQDVIDTSLRTMQDDFPVCEGERFLGLLSQKSLFAATASHSLDAPVVRFMDMELQPVQVGESLFAVQQRLALEGRNSLPVLDNGRFLGLITTRDISETYNLLAHRPDILVSRNQ